MAAGEVVAYAARLSLSEALYVACRLWGRETAYSRMRILLDSGAFTIVEDDEVWEYAADCKCRLPISLGDCYTLATAKKYRVRPLFLKPEREITVNEARLREWLGPGLEPVYLTG